MEDTSKIQKVLIVGGGIGGPTLAISLRRKGMAVEVEYL
jgi:2-polyprenyl-6-methoxyphenol hydroxylase-like FAD-dependent oxidoreductase